MYFYSDSFAEALFGWMPRAAFRLKSNASSTALVQLTNTRISILFVQGLWTNSRLNSIGILYICIYKHEYSLFKFITYDKLRNKRTEWTLELWKMVWKIVRQIVRVIVSAWSGLELTRYLVLVGQVSKMVFICPWIMVIADWCKRQWCCPSWRPTARRVRTSRW